MSIKFYLFILMMEFHVVNMNLIVISFCIVCRSCSGCGKVLEYDLYSDEPTFVKNAAGQVLGFSSSASGFSFWFCLYLTPIASYYWLYILFNGFWLWVCRANWLEEMYVAFRVMTQLLVQGYSRMVWFVRLFLFEGLAFPLFVLLKLS